MPVSSRFAALALAVLLVPSAASADDDTAAYSSAPTAIQLCGGDDPMSASDGCKDGSFVKFSTDLDQGLQAALAKAPANVRPLLKRDQAFVADMLANAIQAGVPRSKTRTDRDAFADMLRRRVTTLGQIAQGFGRPGVAGKWEDAFGSVTVTAAENGAYRVAIDTDSGYNPNDDQRWRCQATAMVKPGANGWFTGALVVEAKKPDAGDTTSPSKPLPLKLRRQGETLRIVSAISYGPDEYATGDNCKNEDQITASYFASGKPDAASDKSDTSFVAPTQDCLRPVTESDEEICADPDLAAQDVRLNRAWKALLPRLDDATRRALTEDQRQWLRQQAGIYPNSIHPGGDKTTYDLHHVGYARFALDKLQRERIALLEGFDLNRKGLLGLWIGHNAILDVTSADAGGGGLQAKGRKWEWDDYKAGCEYDMDGRIEGGKFRSGQGGTNPDTLERDHAMLIVNRLDDAFAKKRHGDGAEDEMKCRRSIHASSTVRLFPARYSVDIDKTGDWHH
jgi:Lysozyme inhibitor LprI